jgi:hypothetical protein
METTTTHIDLERVMHWFGSEEQNSILDAMNTNTVFNYYYCIDWYYYLCFRQAYMCALFVFVNIWKRDEERERERERHMS